MNIMNKDWWVVEIDQGGVTWTPIAYCASERQADDLAKAAHIQEFGKPARVRQYGHGALGQSQQEK
jgi:hypothetical protein